MFDIPKPVLRVAPLVADGPSSVVQPIDLRLDGNEGTPPPENLIDVLHDIGPDVVSSYPSTGELERDLARFVGVELDRVMVTAGADEGLERLFRAFLDPSRNYVLPEPTFEMLPRYGQLVGAELRSVPWLKGGYPITEVMDRIDENTGAVFVVSPNNPTGLSATVDDVDRIVAAAPHALVVVDHAYAEFASDDPTAEVLRHRNVVVARTLSKAWGLAGLRVAYLLGDPGVLRVLRTAGTGYPVAGPSVALARAWLARGRSRLEAFVSEVRSQRDALTSQLRDLGCEVWPSQANFVLTRPPCAAWLLDGLRGLGISVRAFDDPVLESCLRITLPGQPAAFERLCHGLVACLRPQAFLYVLEAGLPEIAELERAREYGKTAVVTTETRGAAVDRLRKEVGEHVDVVAVGRDVDHALETGLAELGSNRAWLWAHSPQWVRAARARGVVPLTRITPSRNDTDKMSLIRAGCARACASFDELLTMENPVCSTEQDTSVGS